MTCYYKDEKATAEVLHDGWLYTGDMAMEDEDGFIYLVDRKKDVIISGGENIYPVQIEDFLRTNNKILDVAVIGLPDHRLGEISAAIIELKPGVECTEEEIDEFCKKLPRYKRPRKLILRCDQMCCTILLTKLWLFNLSSRISRNLCKNQLTRSLVSWKFLAAHLVAAQNQVEIK